MNRYIDFHLLPDPEFPGSFLMNALFAKLHRFLVELNNRERGVSFPLLQQERPTLGDCLRVHGAAESLEQLLARNWLAGMGDHVQILGIKTVPDQAQQHCRVRRVQPKSNVDRLRRRQMRRHGFTLEEAAMRIPDTAEQYVTLPFLQIKSLSTGQQFRLFIDQSKPVPQAVPGEFNSYGLSLTATVPWF
jgi:CRISPR-associated endonuclease Csy4